MEFEQDGNFQRAQFSVSENKEIAQATGRTEKMDGDGHLLEFFYPALPPIGAIFFDLGEFGVKVIQKKRMDDLEDVAFAGVMRSDLAALLRLHDSLEERAEDRGRDARPGEPRTGQQLA